MQPITATMLELLMDCHERELMNLEPHEVASTHYSSGLIRRGFVAIKPYITQQGKKYIAMYITNSGRSFLNSI